MKKRLQEPHMIQNQIGQHFFYRSTVYIPTILTTTLWIFGLWWPSDGEALSYRHLTSRHQFTRDGGVRGETNLTKRAQVPLGHKVIAWY